MKRYILKPDQIDLIITGLKMVNDIESADKIIDYLRYGGKKY